MKTTFISLATFILFFTCFAFAEDNYAKANTPMKVVQIEKKFTDISNMYWAKNEIMSLVENDFMTGDRDLQFRPDNPMTKGDAALVFTRVLQLPPVHQKSIFNDVDDTSVFKEAIMATYQAGILKSDTNNLFGVDMPMTREELSESIMAAFNVELDDRQYARILTVFDKENHLNSHRLSIPSIAGGNLKNKEIVDRATFAYILYNVLIENGTIQDRKEYDLGEGILSDQFKKVKSPVNLLKVSFDEHPIYLRSIEAIEYVKHERIDYGFSRDNIYTYLIGDRGATIALTVRSFDNGDYFLFSEVENPSKQPITVDVLQKEHQVSSYELYRFDENQIKRNEDDLFNADMTSYPTGILRFVKEDGTVQERMIGQAYRSKKLSLNYAEGGHSQMRELLKEEEALSFTKLGSTFMSVHTLESNGEDIVDQWYLNSEDLLFNEDKHREEWMLETSKNYKKRNNWYTASGPFNKMAPTTEPLPENGQGYGRNLLLVKEDRALTLFHQQQDRYFENLIYNAFVNLKNFRGDKPYWETEVTSTYLKELYGMTAPFVDTRFNEQIALFYYRSGDEFGIEESKEPLRNYANLLVSRKEDGHIIPVANGAFYVSDYFPIIQNVTTHSSMNHVLGGMNILLMAYNEFGDEKYLETAKSIQKAIAVQKDEWIRDNGDIWYRISPDLDYKGDDYKHLTLEDLINSYSLWSQIDATYLPVLEEMIAAKAGYLSNEKLGYTTKIKKGLEKIGLLRYLPDGEERTDAL